MNPSISILGNVRAQKAAVTNKEVLKISALGGQVLFKPEKGTILANIASYGLQSPSANTTDSSCSISSSNGGTLFVTCSGSNYIMSTNNSTGENVHYFKNTEVTLDLGLIGECNESNYSGKHVIIVEEGNLIVKSSVYNPNFGPDNYIAIAVLSKDPKTSKRGNLRMDCDVKNTQFTAYLDGALLQNFDSIQYTGEYGLPTDPSAYLNLLMASGSQCTQWKHEGAFISNNTIGGTETNNMCGYQKVSDAEIGKAQVCDLNYQRLVFAKFKLHNGLIVDMSCGKPFGFEDHKDFAENPNAIVCYEYCDPSIYPCMKGSCPFGQYQCNGIDGTKLFDKATSTDGDLYAPLDENKGACGLNNEYGPGYIYQSPNYSSLFKGMFTTKR